MPSIVILMTQFRWDFLYFEYAGSIFKVAESVFAAEESVCNFQKYKDHIVILQATFSICIVRASNTSLPRFPSIWKHVLFWDTIL